MQLAHRAALNGAQLDDIDPRIIIKGIEGGAGKETVSSVSTGKGDGTRITGKRRDAVEVSVRFSMNIRRDSLEERAAVLEAVNAWAVKGGWLTINYKPNRRLWVDEITTPGEGDLWKRLNEYTITFKAHAVPYWQEESAISASSGSGNSGSGAIAVAGSANTVADAELKNLSGATINTATIVIGGNTMAFEGLGMGNGESLVIDHQIVNGKNVIRIRVGGRSAMAMRTEGSADEFEIAPGTCGFSFTARRACRLTVSCRGRFV